MILVRMNEILNQIYSTNYMKEEQAENLESLIQEVCLSTILFDQIGFRSVRSIKH